ncbi:MAG: tRNA (adenosine(37)-N6)-dimethylallyltransferase MiaA [Treponema porcinum]|nr:tRNA (adenosine(37)-N6)-dimethylallyltransferase MiaA [Treponema porcinum]
MRIPVIVVFAPTATGKTALALTVFGRGSHSFFKDKAELISADSMQVYRKLDIGTAKPSFEERQELVHHLIDIRDYTEQYNAADFVSDADLLCREIWERGKIPVVAGGTGFYIRNFLLGLPETPESDETLREELKSRCREKGAEFMYGELLRVDPESAAKIHIHDEYRILRALEVFYLTGKPRSSFSVSNTLRTEYDFTTVILQRDRNVLYRRIDERVEQMFSLGLEEEVRALMAEGACADMPGMKAIGYREWFSGDMESSGGIERIKSEIQHSSRKYAKKQYTFIQGIPGAHFLSADYETALVRDFEECLYRSLKIMQ